MFRELTRKNKEISREECIELLERETRGVLSVIGDHGYPYAMPMNHFYNQADGCIYFHSGRGGHRADALAACDKACFCVTEQGVRAEGEWAYDVRSVVVFGRVELVEDLGVVTDVCTRLCTKFTSDDEYVANEIKLYARGTVILKLTPEHICGKRVREA